MSVSPNHSALDHLYCNETTSDVVALDSDAGLNVEDYDESYLLSLLDSELDQLKEKTKPLEDIHKNTWLISAREEAINWILEVHACYNFTPETAYLSVNYIDRFISSHTLKQGKTWPLKLLAVACLSLAAKMEETKVPFLSDLQMMEHKFMFRPRTIQRMELLVMASLKWRLRAITPFDFAHFFIAKLSFSASTLGNFNYVVSLVSDVIIRTCLVIDFLEFSPSTIAAAAILWVTNEHVVGDKISSYFYKNINKEMVQKCYNLMRRKKIIRRSEHSFPKILQILPPCPTSVLDHAA